MKQVSIMTQEEVNRALARRRTKEKAKKIAANVFVYFVLLLVYAPLIYILVFSFTKHKILGQWNGFTLDNYIALFSISNNKDSAALWTAIGNTALVALISATLSTVLGTIGAIGIFYTRKKWVKGSMDFVTQIPVVDAEIVTAISLCILFVLAARLLNLERNLFTVVIGHMVLSLPYVVLSVKPKLEQMDPSTYEAAMDLGATQTQALWKVVIPDIFPGVLTGFLLSITLSLDDYVITAFTKPTTGGFDTLSTYVDNKIVKGGVPIQLRAFTAILFGIILIVMIVMNMKGSRIAYKLKMLKKETKTND